MSPMPNLVHRVAVAVIKGDLAYGLATEWNALGRAAWDACEDPLDLCSLVDALAVTRPDDALTVRIALGRYVLRLVPGEDPRPRRALETLQRLLDGQATPLDVARASAAVWRGVQRRQAERNPPRPNLEAINAAANACGATSAWRAAGEASQALWRHVFPCEPEVYAATRTAAELEICNVVRGAVACPTTAMLLAAVSP